MEEFVYYNSLYDIYGELLTDKEKDNFIAYYQENYSLAEIADLKNISRNAVFKTIKTVIDKLNYYESKLHIYDINKRLSKSLECNSLDQMKKEIREILGE